MGIIRAVTGAVGGALADQWLEVIEPDNMGDHTVFTTGVPVRKNDKRGQNTKASANTISNGSVVHVYPNQFMLLVDGGKVVDYTAEEGYYKVDQSSMPSLFNGQFGDALEESLGRIKFGGVPSSSQQVFFVNLQEIKGIRFGTRNPISYFDSTYNAELFLRAHGTYSIKITDPLRFYAEAIPRNKDRVEIEDINDQYFSEFMEALQAAINQMSADGVRISYVPSKSRELSKYMSTSLDEDWKIMRGMEVQSVGIASISYDEESQKLINMRNQGAMLSDASIREGYVQGAMARGIESAGSNANGSAAGFMGVGLGMQSGGSMAAAFSQSNQQQMQSQPKEEPKDLWQCACGAKNNGDANFCSKCGAKKPLPADSWECPKCHIPCKGNFCAQCGQPKLSGTKKCPKCGKTIGEDGKTVLFCPECGERLS